MYFGSACYLSLSTKLLAHDLDLLLTGGTEVQNVPDGRVQNLRLLIAPFSGLVHFATRTNGEDRFRAGFWRILGLACFEHLWRQRRIRPRKTTVVCSSHDTAVTVRLGGDLAAELLSPCHHSLTLVCKDRVLICSALRLLFDWEHTGELYTGLTGRARLRGDIMLLVARVIGSGVGVEHWPSKVHQQVDVKARLPNGPDWTLLRLYSTVPHCHAEVAPSLYYWPPDARPSSASAATLLCTPRQSQIF